MDLNRAVTFVRVVETGGFTRAAEALGVPTSSVSRSVAKLERELGVALLERTTRHVGLTDAGRAFFERARDALVGLDQASELALDAVSEANGVVRVAAPPDFGPLAGATVADILARYPRLRIELAFTPRGAELVGDLVDVAIAFGKLPDSELVAKKLGQNVHKLYAAPAYLAARGTPRTIAELAAHDVALSRAVAGDARWELRGPKGIERVDVTARLVADHLQFVMDATLAGAGIAQLPVFLAEQHVAKRALAPVLPRYEIDTPLYVLTHAARHLPHRVALVRDALVAKLGRQCTAHAG